MKLLDFFGVLFVAFWVIGSALSSLLEGEEVGVHSFKGVVGGVANEGFGEEAMDLGFEVFGEGSVGD